MVVAGSRSFIYLHKTSTYLKKRVTFKRLFFTVPSEGRIVDLWLLDLIERYIQFIKDNEMEPWTIERYEFDDTIIDK